MGKALSGEGRKWAGALPPAQVSYPGKGCLESRETSSLGRTGEVELVLGARNVSRKRPRLPYRVPSLSPGSPPKEVQPVVRADWPRSAVTEAGGLRGSDVDVRSPELPPQR